ncbi:hypothetical protein DICVIV_09303 [Dictyocaulus viviparus]|uniref:Vta1 C-terminal domain-containing protein n=1 Tax=Dictyocaulus viviparus TaxID=29172 RepID=A0A0D8XQL0_DICVI|nr:hypothetical protein DICVIV_09303 [Dictyocaulus viviparus]
MAAKVPASLRPIAHYIKIANDNSSRDPVVYYWCLFYAAQNAMQLDKSSPEALHFLTGLLSTLESIKKQLIGNEAITNEVVAQAHLENFALKLFNFADAKEKTGQVDKNVVHAFYTADSTSNVGSHTSVENHRPDDQSTLSRVAQDNPIFPHSEHGHSLPYRSSQLLPRTSEYGFAELPNVPGASCTYPPSSELPSQSQLYSGKTVSTSSSIPEMSGLNIDSSKNGDWKPSVEAFDEARKFTKYALSAIDYEDTRAVVDNLRKALALMEH